MTGPTGVFGLMACSAASVSGSLIAKFNTPSQTGQFMASDVDGAAPAAVDGPSVSEAPPAPLNTEGNPQSAVDAKEERKAEEAKAPEDKPAKPVTARDALKNAAAKVDADEKARAQAEKPDKAPAPVKDSKPAEAKPAERARTETGQFASTKPDDAKSEVKPSNYVDPPSRFSAEAKTAWKDAPEPVRAEVHRATKELEQGLQKYKGDADAFGEVREFADLAKSQGTTLKEAMSRYVGMENMLRKDPIAGLQQIAQNLGIPLRDIAAHIVNQKPDQVAGQQDRVIAELRQTVTELKQQIGGVTKTIEQQRQDASTSTVVAFASQPGHERFEYLAPHIKRLLESGEATDLESAYQKADTDFMAAAGLNPRQANPAHPASEPERTTQPAAQNRAGTKSITGAPGRGSTPLNTPASSPRKALERAFAAAGR